MSSASALSTSPICQQMKNETAREMKTSKWALSLERETQKTAPYSFIQNKKKKKKKRNNNNFDKANAEQTTKWESKVSERECCSEETRAIFWQRQTFILSRRVSPWADLHDSLRFIFCAGIFVLLLLIYCAYVFVYTLSALPPFPVDRQAALYVCVHRPMKPATK